VATSISGRARTGPKTDRRDVRAAAYGFLEHAKYRHPEDGLVPFAPTRRKIDDVIDALRAVVPADSSANAPFWLDQRSHPAHEYIALANGLLHQPDTHSGATHRAVLQPSCAAVRPFDAQAPPRTSGSRSSLNCGARTRRSRHYKKSSVTY
jgi:hypothetical protein